jgi:membrane protease YdiL (CAAX protease family)
VSAREFAASGLRLVWPDWVREQTSAEREAIVAVLAYGTAIVAAETLLVAFGPVPSVTAHALILLVLINHWGVAGASGSKAALLALALLPLLRILSVTMPLDGVAALYQYELVGAPLGLAVAVVALVASPPGAAAWLAVGSRSWRRELVVALSGLPLGAIAFALLDPPVPVERTTWPTLLAGAFILFVFTGLVEEVLFRGLLQGSLVELLGGSGILVTALLYAAMHLGTRSPLAVALALVVGLFFGWIVARTGSLLGVAGAHGLLNAGALLVWPALT